jgi:hypothetical protein
LYTASAKRGNRFSSHCSETYISAKSDVNDAATTRD